MDLSSPHPLGRAPISAMYGIVGIPFVSLKGRNCRFRSQLGCSGLGSAFSLECLDAPVVLLTIYLDQDGSTGFLRIKASRTVHVERKEISLFKNGKPSDRRKRRNNVDHIYYFTESKQAHSKFVVGTATGKKKKGPEGGQ